MFSRYLNLVIGYFIYGAAKLTAQTIEEIISFLVDPSSEINSLEDVWKEEKWIGKIDPEKNILDNGFYLY